MRRNFTPAMGALHPILFFLFVYGISLFLAIFVCRTVYYSMHEESKDPLQDTKVSYTLQQSHTTALR